MGEGAQLEVVSARETHAALASQTWVIEIGGRVQGVGFRPFVYCLAGELGLYGEVCNELGTVRIVATGNPVALQEFRDRLVSDAPSLALPSMPVVEIRPTQEFSEFSIRQSRVTDQAKIFVPPDNFACDLCLDEMRDANDRRYRYPFINCTQCGPRYTLIEALPYDRPNTSMAGFPLCADCEKEYRNPADRRFHAEPIACPVCGPQLAFRKEDAKPITDSEAALAATLAELRDGKVVAIKGIGGYHLCCDATNPEAVARLRERKHRPDKPLAVMFPFTSENDQPDLNKSVSLSAAERELLQSSARPIVLAKRKSDCPLAKNLAPGLAELGVFLPYSPLHVLLLEDFGGPLVATSGNISGEPVLTGNREADARLADIGDAFLHHDRGIVRPADDAVFRQIGTKMRPLRVGRGVAPVEIKLPWRQDEPVLCLGGQQKATVTLSFDDRAIVSPHIGDMDSPRSMDVFTQLLTDLQHLHGIEAKRMVCDAHTGYASSRWARQQSLPVETVWHHHAHASALVAETGTSGPWLVFTWDGVGLGEDGTLWGGEALFGDAGDWQRVCSFRQFAPPGGDKAGREPWRSAAALCWEAGEQVSFEHAGIDIARAAWRLQMNSPQTSAVGRLFDAASSLICGVHETSFEAQGPMKLEALCKRTGDSIPLPLLADDNGMLRSDWSALLPILMDSRRDAADRAQDFHSTMARVVLDQAIAIRELHGEFQVGLSGGVFQNRVLAEQAFALLTGNGFDVHMHSRLPCNDAGISLGQAAEWAARCAVRPIQEAG